MLYFKKKIDKRRHYYLAIDTETCGSIGKPFVYDLGGKIIDSHGETYEKFSWVLHDVYAGMRERMKTAYYVNKLPQYEKGLKTGEWKMVKAETAFKTIRNMMRDYGITEVVAYNTNFDRRALDNTIRATTKYRFFFPAETEFLDIWNMACSTLYQRKTFFDKAHKNGWQSEKGNVRTNAEVGYAYITKMDEFEERHTALEDVKIEVEIFMACLRAKVKSADKQCIGNPWRKPQPKWKEYKAERA